MSGLSLRVMMVRAGSSNTVVLKASRSPSPSQPSSKASRRSALEAPGMVRARAAPAPPLGFDDAAGGGLDGRFFSLLFAHRLAPLICCRTLAKHRERSKNNCPAGRQPGDCSCWPSARRARETHDHRRHSRAQRRGHAAGDADGARSGGAGGPGAGGDRRRRRLDRPHARDRRPGRRRGARRSAQSRRPDACRRQRRAASLAAVPQRRHRARRRLGARGGSLHGARRFRRLAPCRRRLPLRARRRRHRPARARRPGASALRDFAPALRRPGSAHCAAPPTTRRVGIAPCR